MSARAAIVLASATLFAGCGDGQKDSAAKSAPRPTPTANADDPLVGTWTRDGALTFESSRAHFDRLAALRPEAEGATLMEEARVELLDSPWTLVIAADGTLVLDALTRTPGTGKLEQQHWLGTWTRSDTSVVLEVDSTRPGAEQELTKLTGTLTGNSPDERLTFGGPPGNPRGVVLEFGRARD